MTWKREGSGRGGRPWRRKRDRVLSRDGHLCQPCRRSRRLRLATQVDHIIGLAEGGTDHESNLQAICDDCHERKTQREAKRAQGAKTIQAGADQDGMPVDPEHPWNREG